MSEKRIELGHVYSAKVGGAYVAVRADKALGHGRYQGMTVRPDGTGSAVKFATDAVRGEGMPEAAWREKHTPRTNDLPVPPPGQPATAKSKAGRKAKAAPKERKTSGLDAAVRVLREAGKPMKMDDVVKLAIEKGYWSSGGKTPAATVYAAVIREIAAKGKASRFARVQRNTTTDGVVKKERGWFELTAAGKGAK